MSEIFAKAGAYSFVGNQVGKYAIGYSSREDYSMREVVGGTGADWDIEPITINGVRCVPWGDMPIIVRDILERNNVGPGVLNKKLGLIYGQGPALYKWRTDPDTGERTRFWVQDREIQNWLESWDSNKYIRNALVEYLYSNGVFTKYINGRSVRVGRPWVAKLECVDSTSVLCEWPEDDIVHYDHIKSFLVGDIRNHRNLELYPKFDKWDPCAHECAIGYSNMRSFGRNLYSVSSFWGSIPWMNNANDLPEIVRVLNENIIAAAYIVHEPAGYWDEKLRTLQEIHPEWTEMQYRKELDRIQDEITRKLADVMAGKRNVGKFFTCVDFTDPDGHQQSWKIDPIEMNIDKYISAQKDIAKMADSATTTGMGLTPSLSGIIIDGKSDSGSQMLYAAKMFYATDTQIPEEVAFEALNDAIRINFPEKRDIHVGCYRQMIQKEDNVSAGDRAINNI